MAGLFLVKLPSDLNDDKSTQPMWGCDTVSRPLSLAGCIHRMIPVILYTEWVKQICDSLDADILFVLHDSALAWHWSPVASFTKEVNPRLAKRPLVFNGRLANRE